MVHSQGCCHKHRIAALPWINFQSSIEAMQDDISTASDHFFGGASSTLRPFPVGRETQDPVVADLHSTIYFQDMPANTSLQHFVATIVIFLSLLLSCRHSNTKLPVPGTSPAAFHFLLGR